MRAALDSYVIRGVTHNINFLRSLCDHPRFIKGDISTYFIPQEYPQGYKGATLNEQDEIALMAASLLVQSRSIQNQISVSGQLASFDPVSFHRNAMNELCITNDHNKNTWKSRLIEFAETGETATISTVFTDPNGKDHNVEAHSAYQRGDLVFTVSVNGKTYTVQVINVSDGSANISIQYAGTTFTLAIRTPQEERLHGYMPIKKVIDTTKVILSPMPGAVFSIKVNVGDSVVTGQELCVVEAMKMQNALRSQKDGKVKAIKVKQGQTVAADQVLIELE